LNTYILEDNLLISSPGVGGLTYLEGRNQVTISTKASTGIYIGKEGLFCGLQENGGNHLILAKDGASDDIELAKDALDIHDVLVHENLIYFVATQTNAVVCLNSDFKIVDSWQLSGEEDSSHINSVAVYKGRLIASAFGNFKLHREYKNGTQGLGRVFDVRTGETLIEGLSQPHSLTVENNYLYLCSSEENTLHIYEDQTLIKSVLIPGYARGVAVGEDYIYVGISLSRNVNSDISKLTSGAIAVIDKKSMIIVGLNMLPFREVYDIRIVNQHSNIFSIFQTTQLEIKALKLNLESSKSEIEDLSKAVQDREQILKNIMASMSWKLTKPLRIIKAIILSAYK
jgi:Domain of unknown function (DUF4915)